MIEANCHRHTHFDIISIFDQQDLGDYRFDMALDEGHSCVVSLPISKLVRSNL